MGDFDDFDLDRSTASAWSRLQGQLADYLSEMVDNDLLLIEVETTIVADDDDGTTPYVQFCGWGETLVRAEVSSNAYLAAGCALDDAAMEHLVQIGWSSPTYGAKDEPDGGSANFYLDAARRDADLVAARTVMVLREVLGVTHPAFLRSAGIETRTGSAPADSPADDSAADDSRANHDAAADEPLAVEPESADHLRTLVAAAISPEGGLHFEYDEDGDIAVPFGSAVVYVRVHETAAVVELYSCVVSEIRDVDQAAFEVATLNRDYPLLKFVLVDRAVLALAMVSAMPFAPRHLQVVLPVMAEMVDRVDDDLVARVGGRRAIEPEIETEAETTVEPDDEPDDEPTHPVLRTLRQLDLAGSDVDADLAARMCKFDYGLVLRLLEEAETRDLTWQGTVAVLRGALQLIVEREQDRASHPASRGPDRGPDRGPGRSARQEVLFEDGDVPGMPGQDQLFDVPGE